MACDHRYCNAGVAPPGYEFCPGCGTYRSTAFRHGTAGPAGHWKDAAHASVWEQVYNVDLHTEGGVSKNRFVLERIESARASALEIGCAPGRLLYWLKWAARFERVVGIDPSDPAPIRQIGCFDGDLLTGLFPKVVSNLRGAVDYIVGLDVFEHSPDPEAFLAAAAGLLAKRGQLFLMMPMSGEVSCPGRFFAPAEHAFIHSKPNLAAMLREAGLADVKFDRWADGHSTVSARKP